MRTTQFTKKSIIDIKNFDILDFDTGGVYFLLSRIPEVQRHIFEQKSNISFINSPFQEAIKVPVFIKKKSKSFVSDIINEINALKISNNRIDRFSLYEQIVIILYDQMKNKDIVVIETTGLDELSIIRLLNFTVNLSKVFTQKIIFIVENRLPIKDNSNIIVQSVNAQFVNSIETDGLKNFFE